MNLGLVFRFNVVAYQDGSSVRFNVFANVIRRGNKWFQTIKNAPHSKRKVAAFIENSPEMVPIKLIGYVRTTLHISNNCYQ